MSAFYSRRFFLGGALAAGMSTALGDARPLQADETPAAQPGPKAFRARSNSG